MGIARIVGVFVSWAVWVAATMNLNDVLRSPHSSRGMRFAVVAGFILGNYVYTRLWIEEGRARERAGRGARRRRQE